MLRLLERWPTASALAGASRQDIIDFARARHSGYLQRVADLVARALAEEYFTAPAHLARAKADTIRLLARQLLLIDAQRNAWEKQMGHLLLGTPGRSLHLAAGDRPDPDTADCPRRCRAGRGTGPGYRVRPVEC